MDWEKFWEIYKDYWTSYGKAALIFLPFFGVVWAIAAFIEARHQ